MPTSKSLACDKRAGTRAYPSKIHDGGFAKGERIAIVSNAVKQEAFLSAFALSARVFGTKIYQHNLLTDPACVSSIRRVAGLLRDS
jgi:hypothetical protein